MSPKKLWQRRLADGSEVAATLFHDVDLNECTAEIAVRAPAHSDDIALSFATAICKALDQRGAVVIEQETAE
jgi:hypothetical protein